MIDKWNDMTDQNCSCSVLVMLVGVAVTAVKCDVWLYECVSDRTTWPHLTNNRPYQWGSEVQVKWTKWTMTSSSSGLWLWTTKAYWGHSWQMSNVRNGNCNLVTVQDLHLKHIVDRLDRHPFLFVWQQDWIQLQFVTDLPTETAAMKKVHFYAKVLRRMQDVTISMAEMTNGMLENIATTQSGLRLLTSDIQALLQSESDSWFQQQSHTMRWDWTCDFEGNTTQPTAAIKLDWTGFTEIWILWKVFFHLVFFKSITWCSHGQPVHCIARSQRDQVCSSLPVSGQGYCTKVVLEFWTHDFYVSLWMLLLLQSSNVISIDHVMSLADNWQLADGS